MSTELPILYTFRRCPYAMRARIALVESNTKVIIREILLKDKPEHMLEISPKGTVPVLLLPDGKVIDESYDVMCWCLPEQKSAKTDELISENDTFFKKHLDRYKYFERYPETTKEKSLENCLLFLKKLEALFSNGRKFGLLDYALFPFVRQFVKSDEDVWKKLEFPNLKNWFRNLSATPAYLKAMEKYEVWGPDQEPITLF